jgi:uncharacterized protein
MSAPWEPSSRRAYAVYDLDMTDDLANALPPGRSRETKIRRDARGRWWNDGVEITHVLLARAFDRWLGLAPDGSGRYCLSNDINWAYVEIEGAPRFVRSAAIDVVSGEVRLSLSDDTECALDPETLRQDRDGALYCDVPGGLTARFDPHAAMQLEPLVREDDAGVFLMIGGTPVRPRVVENPLAMSLAGGGASA